MMWWRRRYDVVEAVLKAQGRNPAGARRAAGQLSAWVARPDWSSLLPAYARCVRILRAAPGAEAGTRQVDGSLLAEPAERALFAALGSTAGRKPGSVDEFLNMVAGLVPAINAFFDQVLVMAEADDLKRNRLALVAQVARLSDGIADLSTLEGF